MSDEPIIVVENAVKIFESARGPVHALGGFNLTVHEGEFVTIVGPSGCGKSTLLWAMAALWPLTSGSIRIAGQEVVGPRREVGMVFQSANLLPFRRDWRLRKRLVHARPQGLFPGRTHGDHRHRGRCLPAGNLS